MKRREFITFLGSAAVSWPLPARAQETRMPVIGFLSISPRVPSSGGEAAFRQGLAEAGFIVGRNVAIDGRRTNDPSSFPRLAAELVDRKVDVIVTVGSPYAPVAAKDATSTIPIVFQLDDDPVKYGLVTSLSRPGGNVTGMNLLTGELAGKRLNFLVELIPQATTIGYLSPPSSAQIFEDRKSDMLAAGHALGREIIVSEVRGLDFKTAFTTLVEQRAGALIVAPFTNFQLNRDKIVELAARHKIAAMYHSREFVVDGGLMSYAAAGPIARDLARNYVVPILRGAKPAELPVRQPTQFALVINLKTARELGLTIPRSLLAAATELIE